MSDATLPAARTTPKIEWTWAGFLAAAFVALGLMGLFATFAAPLPLQRAILREATLDQAQVAVHGSNPAAALAALGEPLDDSAGALIRKEGGIYADIDQRIAAERVAMRARMVADGQALAVRLRWLICIVTLMAAAFGCAVLAAGRRR